MIDNRSLSLIPPQRAISSSVRPQPEQRPAAASITQTLMQGVEVIGAPDALLLASRPTILPDADVIFRLLNRRLRFA